MKFQYIFLLALRQFFNRKDTMFGGLWKYMCKSGWARDQLP